MPVRPEKFQSEEAAGLFDDLTAIREVLSKFAKGDLDGSISVQGACASCLKTLQANLRHLTWQVQQVADGDFTQRVDFLGHFSIAFNHMVERLRDSVTSLQEREESLLKLTSDLRANKERWNLAVQCSRDGIWDIDVLNKSAWYSDSFMQMMHYTVEDLPRDLRWDLLVHPEDQDQADVLRQVFQAPDNITPFSVEFRLRNHNGDYLWIRLRGMPVRGEPDSIRDESLDSHSGVNLPGIAAVCADSKKVHRLIAVASDISAQKEIEHSLAHLALHDNLTGLPNRHLLNDRMQQYIARSVRTGDPFIFVTLDLDNFKGVNDTYGHAAGDRLLVEFSKRMLMGMRNTDTAARTGGDEFVMVFPCAAGMEMQTTKHIMKRFFANLSHPVDFDGVPYTIHSSLGVAFFPQHAADVVKIFAYSDAALYRAKRSGKNKFAVWEPADGG
ncbi:MAG: diguanylate cyclase [Planctomycetaceae bacterium]|nr:diguanylate cyclase [Planctomycetaceae bacterium]